ncbi:MAG: hypothetical protein JNL83_21205 [Myxococcales bacterium]|nr:hypothetical protein [Myxococcales bacterium]
MSAQIRQESQAFVRDARRRTIGLAAATGVAAVWLALAASPMAQGFGTTALVAAGALAAVSLVQWWRGARFTTQVIAALERGEPVAEFRVKLARSVAWLHRVQNAALVLGIAVIVSAVRTDTELASGAAFGVISLLIVEQLLDHAAVERAERFDRLLASARVAPGQ